MSKAAKLKRDAMTVLAPPSPGRTADEILADRIERFARLQAHEDARALIPILFRDSLPIGIQVFGDPHLDNVGTDLGLVKSHALIVRETEGAYAMNIGDTTDNWIGRLERLYAEADVTKSESLILTEWFLQTVRDWMLILKGNHDLWGGDTLDWVARLAKAFIQDSEARVALRFPNGREIRINARHEHKGKSMYNAAHGPLRQLHMGKRDHIAISGHTHESGYSILKDQNSGILMHAIKVASYKKHDKYARTEGFPDQTASPCVFLVIDPTLPDTHPDQIKHFWCPFRGAAYLTFVREMARRTRKAA